MVYTTNRFSSLLHCCMPGAGSLTVAPQFLVVQPYGAIEGQQYSLPGMLVYSIRVAFRLSFPRAGQTVADTVEVRPQPLFAQKNSDLTGRTCLQDSRPGFIRLKPPTLPWDKVCLNLQYPQIKRSAGFFCYFWLSRLVSGFVVALKLPGGLPVKSQDVCCFKARPAAAR